VSFKRAAGKPRVEYDEAVEELLCFGWIDGKAGTLDDERSMIWCSPRQAASGWSRSNKERVERLAAAGLMTEAGLRAIQVAKANGAWSRLDEAEELVVPGDLAEAFGRYPGAAEAWEGFSRSARRAILLWIVEARRPETRAARVEESARLASKGEKAR
jgi:uncharacterized protein YdeI (YjbR/CyaY-like superfamily)